MTMSLEKTYFLNVASKSLICFRENSLNSVYGLKTRAEGNDPSSIPSLILFLLSSFWASSSVSDIFLLSDRGYIATGLDTRRYLNGFRSAWGFPRHVIPNNDVACERSEVKMVFS